MVQKQGVADVVERWAVLAGRHGTVGGPGEAMKIHYSFFLSGPLSHVSPGPPNPPPMAAALAGHLQVLEIDTISKEIPVRYGLQTPSSIGRCPDATSKEFRWPKGGCRHCRQSRCRLTVCLLRCDKLK